VFVLKEKDQTILKWYVSIIYGCKVNPLKQQREREILSLKSLCIGTPGLQKNARKT